MIEHERAVRQYEIKYLFGNMYQHCFEKKKKEQCQGLYGFNCQHAVPAHRMQLTPIYLRYAANDLYSQL